MTICYLKSYSYVESLFPDGTAHNPYAPSQLCDTGTYSKEYRAYHHPKTAALERTSNWQNKKTNWNISPKPGTFKNRSKPERKCYFCQKPGHFIKDCRKRKAQNANRQNIRTAVVEVGSDHASETFEEFMQRMHTNETVSSLSSSAIGPRNNDMVTTMNINGHKAKTLLDTGTTGTNLISGMVVQTYNI